MFVGLGRAIFKELVWKGRINNPCGTNQCTCRKFGLNCVQRVGIDGGTLLELQG